MRVTLPNRPLFIHRRRRSSRHGGTRTLSLDNGLPFTRTLVGQMATLHPALFDASNGGSGTFRRGPFSSAANCPWRACDVVDGSRSLIIRSWMPDFQARSLSQRSDSRVHPVYLRSVGCPRARSPSSRSSTTPGCSGCGRSTSCRPPGGSFRRPSTPGSSTCSGRCTWPAGRSSALYDSLREVCPDVPSRGLRRVADAAWPPCCTTWATGRSAISSTSISWPTTA